MNGLIEIHEFSTGIEIIGTPGNWKVGGFTGNYLNSTLASVPTPVQNAISSEYFAVAESTSSDNPAVIGREIIVASGEWSVVAVVTKGTDNMGRTASLYRYFLCEGARNIRYILQWMYQKKRGILVFDPFDQQTIGNPHRYEITSSKSINLRPELEALLDGSSTVIVPSAEPCAPIILNAMANLLRVHPVSWAYHVKGIANPSSFQIIQPVDSQSEQIIRKAIARTPKRPQLQGEEQPITTAIKGLTREKFKPEHLQTIEKALANPRINNEDWKLLFDKQGAKDAIKDKIYTLSTVRLLTLQAMVLPETLPAFLSWIQTSNNQQNYNISHTLQNQVYKYYLKSKIDSLVDKLREGIITIIPKLIEQPELLDSTVWLLGENQGIWGGLYRSKIMPAIDQDFQSIAECYRTKQNEVKLEVLSHPAWEKIFKNIQPFWQPYAVKYKQKDYQPIADFFREIITNYEEFQLYALFLYISQGKISKKLYISLNQEDKNPKTQNGIYVDVYNVSLEREVPRSEKLYLGAKSNTKKLYSSILNFILILWTKRIRLLWFIVIIPISFSGGIYYYKNFQTEEPGPGPILATAFDKFGTTKKVIKEEIYQPLFDEFNNGINDLKKLRIEIIKAIRKTLDPENKLNLNYPVIEKKDLDIENNPTDKKLVENWIEAILAYQKNKQQEIPSIEIVGYLVSKGETNEPLRKDIRKNISSEIIIGKLEPPCPEPFAKFETTRKVIQEEIYQPLFDEFEERTNDPKELRIGINNTIRKALDNQNLQYGAVIENENLDIKNNSKEKQWVKQWIESIRSYQQKKQKEITSINATGCLSPNGLTNEPLRDDIRENIDLKSNITPSEAPPQPQEDGQ